MCILCLNIAQNMVNVHISATKIIKSQPTQSEDSIHQSFIKLNPSTNTRMQDASQIQFDSL